MLPYLSIKRSVWQRFISLVIITLCLVIFLCQFACENQSQRLQPDRNIAQNILPGQIWMDHLNKDLLPFWIMDSAFGQPKGNFPTFRCNDGSLFNPDNPCVELKKAEPWISDNLNKDYTRMKSRQIFLYGVAYHLTGDERMLELAKAGVDYLRNHAIDKNTGSAISYWTDGVPGPPILQRTSQDLAYAQLGLAFFYYLTRDDAVLEDIIRLKNYIFINYYNRNRNMVMWVKQNSNITDNIIKESEGKELVAQLDQINAYMLLLTPTLTASLQQQWKNDLIKLSEIMISQFYEPKYNLFWGSITNETDKKLGSDHTDFGHTIKTFWMIYQVGKITENKDLINFVERRAPEVLEKAYLKESGSWASRMLPDGKLDENKEWWIYAELDQMAATLSLKDPSFVKYLTNTYNYWFKYMVDHKNHEIWHMVIANDHSTRYPKIHLWKNGYHSFEHTLIGYITSQAVRRDPIVLYYAFKKEPQDSAIRPYFFSGRLQDKQVSPLYKLTDYKKYKITFNDIR